MLVRSYYYRPMGLRTDTKERMVDAALGLFQRQGFDRTGFSEILRESGAARGAIYHHFPGGKEELALEVVKESTARITDRVLRTAAGRSPSTALRRYIAETIANLEANDYADGCPLAPIALETTNWSEPIRHAVRNAFETWRQAIESALVSAGASRAKARRLGEVVIASIEGAIIMARTSRDPAPLRAVADVLGPVLDDATA